MNDSAPTQDANRHRSPSKIYRQENDAIEIRLGCDSCDMRLLTRAAAEGKDVPLCAGPQKKPLYHLSPGRSLMMMLCRCRDLRKARSSSTPPSKNGPRPERENSGRLETRLVRSTRRVEASVTSFRDLLSFYLECTSAHGLPRAARTNSCIRRVLWAGTFVFFVAYFMYQCVALLTMFYNFPVGVKIVIEQKRVIEFPAVTVCNLNIMKVSRLMEDPKYQNLGRIDSKVKRQLHHLLNALHLEETKSSTDPEDLLAVLRTSGQDDDDDEHDTRHGDDSTTKKPDRKLVRQEGTLLNRNISDDQNQDTSSNATDRKSTARGTKPIPWINTTSNESIIEDYSGYEALIRNKKDAEFNRVANDISRDLKDFKYQDNNFGGVSNDYEFDLLMDHSMTSDYSDMLDLLKPTSEDLEKYGHKAKDFIIQCSMDSRNCSYRVANDISRDLKDFKYQDNNFGGVSNDYEFDLLMDHSMTSDYSDMLGLLKPSSEDLEKYGHKAKDFIIKCSMDSRDCSHRDFHRLESPYYGNCFTFNHGSEEFPLIQSSKYGSRYGLRLTLNIEHDEYLGLFSQKAGVRVAIHPFNIPPFPEDFGLNASPGSETEIGVTMEKVSRLPFPYPTNCTDRRMYYSSMPWAHEGLYTVMSCIKSCLQRRMERYCGCVDSEVTSAESSVPRCLSTNSTQEKCRQTVRYLFETNHQGCDCPPPCQEVMYKTTISSTVWPSEPYANLLSSAVMEEKAYFRKSDIFKSIKRNLASLHIYLSDMNIKKIDEYPSYPWDRLLADIGGMLGLFVGISACTVMELVEFLFDVLLLSFRKCRT